MNTASGDRLSPNAIRRVVIVGGGTAGWMTAAALSQHLRHTGVRITVVESSEIGTIGVGEATIPTIRRFYAQLGMTDAEVMTATQASCKLGIRFTGWSGAGSDFIHPFGLYGQDLRGVGFHHYWAKQRQTGDQTPLAAYSLGAALAFGGKFIEPSPTPPSSLSVFDWALHLDASLFAQHLRRYAEASGVERIDARIVDVQLRPEDGFVRAVTLGDGREVEGDLFVDCSGFRGLLIGEALGSAYEDWGQWLACDAAFAVQSENGPGMEPHPYTQVTAHAAGWQWGIPLRHRAGNGLVFSSAHMTDQQALDALMPNLMGKPLMEPRRIGFRPGRRDRAWVKNCVSIGLSAGFLEPLESTSIALIENGIERLKSLFPDKTFAPSIIDEFNDQSAREMERTRDFIILHYWLNGRDEPFWQERREAAIPDTLARKVELWKARGQFVRYRWEMFHPASWLAIYDGFGVLPEQLDPAVEGLDPGQLANSLHQMKASVAETVARTPSHAAFLARLDRPVAA
ncbi:tryptophan halogenase family protein [Brevundimonas goettingensis]|uniref:Tryptophan 7-halogenase n=1 Tax=Brevundimonas goettingensis TaxID=2774190 RepID=A0A975GW63_9CAUL|nr:tryptophan halogenase family protein [Brevundimonas goettingensis]QTC92276.1 tryptophan 7-halogenase [Brevundimonas goettingensis]